MEESSLAHTRWDCTYHIVWIPKYRRMILYGQFRQDVGRVIRDLLAKKPGIEIIEGKACPDHIHLCLRIPPKYAISDVMGYVKGKSAMAMHDLYPEWRSRTGKDRTLWARGYYVRTVGLNEATIKKYIKDQEKGSQIG